MKIGNGFLSLNANVQGAEITSLKNANGLEYLWQADAKHWGRHAPILFPIVGKLNGDRYNMDNETYVMSQHGFARDMDFKLKEEKSDQLTFVLHSNEKTRSNYPWEFELHVIYSLEGPALRVSYLVVNPSDRPLLFSLGGHPAFNCPLDQSDVRSDYWLEFEHDEKLVAHRLENGLFSGETELISLVDKQLLLTDHLFDKDALVFKHLNSKKITLCSKQKRWLTFHFEGFPYLGIWSKSEQSPFVCIEPWFGLADHQGFEGSLSGKEGIQLLAPGKSFNCSYVMEIHL